MHRLTFIAFAFCLGLWPVSRLSATPRVWIGGSDGDWFLAGNWDPADIPAAGDAVTVSSGSILLTNATAALTSFTIGNATLTFSNWPTALSATTVTIQSGGMLTHAVCATNLSADNTNRVVLVCTDLSIATGGLITADAKGYPGGNANGFGPGAGHSYSAGGGYGGVGGRSIATTGSGTYGSADLPTEPGSGGAGGGAWGLPGIGGAGGGVIRIEASGHVDVNGTLTANGDTGSANQRGGGSGGSIFIQCATFGGSGGIIRAHGGNGSGTGNACSGGGGRIRVVCSDDAAQELLPVPDVGFSANRGTTVTLGDIGSVYLSPVRLLPSVLSSKYNGRLSGFTNWSHATWIISNSWIGTDGVRMTVSNDWTVRNGARLDARNAQIEVGGNVTINGGSLYLFADGTNRPSLSCDDLTLTNSARFDVHGGATNPATADYGARVAIGGTLALTSGCLLYPTSNPTNGGSPFISMNRLVLSSGAQINANGRGFAGGLSSSIPGGMPGYGPGGGNGNAGGGGHGGRGGRNPAGFGETNGCSNAPINAGSGGGAWTIYGNGGYGGGVVRLWIDRTAILDGTMSANGGSPGGGYWSGGAGGSIFIRAHTLTASAGTLSAVGGNGSTAGSGGGGGCGGGGRIALHFIRNDFSGVMNVAGGVGSEHPGEPGTIVLIQRPPEGSVIMLR